VRICVSNLDLSVAFYNKVIGLTVLEMGDTEVRGGRLAKLGASGGGPVLLELEQRSDVKPLGTETRLGLYHAAFLLPSRKALSGFVRHLLRLRVGFGSADHGVSEAIYLTDPDGLAVEVYADRPRSEWRVRDSKILSGIEPLRFRDLPAVQEDSWQGAPAGTTVGHVHFFGDDLIAAAAFYQDGLGMDQVMWSLPGALFLSAGGYHHHVGVNVWAAGSPQASDEEARLLFWELVLPDASEVERVAASMKAAGLLEATTPSGARAFVDPWGIRVALVAEAS
jgi:catechol 2,3-dioxygenase